MSAHYDRISASEWAWIARDNRIRAEAELEKAKREEDEARREIGLKPLWSPVAEPAPPEKEGNAKG